MIPRVQTRIQQMIHCEIFIIKWRMSRRLEGGEVTDSRHIPHTNLPSITQSKQMLSTPKTPPSKA